MNDYPHQDDNEDERKLPAIEAPLIQKAKGDNKRPNKKMRKAKAPDAPKRPLSAYNLFFREERVRWLKERQGGTGKEKSRELFALMGKEIAARWKVLAPEETARYKHMAEVHHRRFLREKEAFVAEKNRKAIKESNTKGEVNAGRNRLQSTSANLDGHHDSSMSSLGDGVEEAFWNREHANPLTLRETIAENITSGARHPPPYLNVQSSVPGRNFITVQESSEQKFMRTAQSVTPATLPAFSSLAPSLHLGLLQQQQQQQQEYARMAVSGVSPMSWLNVGAPGSNPLVAQNIASHVGSRLLMHQAMQNQNAGRDSHQPVLHQDAFRIISASREHGLLNQRQNFSSLALPTDLDHALEVQRLLRAHSLNGPDQRTVVSAAALAQRNHLWAEINHPRSQIALGLSLPAAAGPRESQRETLASDPRLQALLELASSMPSFPQQQQR